MIEDIIQTSTYHCEVFAHKWTSTYYSRALPHYIMNALPLNKVLSFSAQDTWSVDSVESCLSSLTLCESHIARCLLNRWIIWSLTILYDITLVLWLTQIWKLYYLLRVLRVEVPLLIESFSLFDWWIMQRECYQYVERFMEEWAYFNMDH